MDVYLSDNGVLIGSAREAQQLNELTGEELRNHAVTQKDREISRKRMVLESRIASLKEEFESVQDELNKAYVEEDLKKSIMERNRRQLSNKRSNKTNGKKN
jgi:circadian clock protein KaiC